MVRRFVSRTAFSAVALALIASWASAGYNVSATCSISEVDVGEWYYDTQSWHSWTLITGEEVDWYMYMQLVVTGPSPGSKNGSDSGTTNQHVFDTNVRSVFQANPDDGSYSVYASTNMSAWGGSEGTKTDSDSDTGGFSFP